MEGCFPDEDATTLETAEGEVWVDNYPKERQAGATWLPFESEDRWELARWLMSTGISQKKMDAMRLGHI
ncbi:hypothetical protein B0H34DRAFT_700943 [Crassisporium funariophilum]|nr:hypothetical protein B0H34DRAFT_700943 [Crassisporium funariophilum]